MLFSLIAFAEVFASGSWQPFSTAETSAEALNPQFRPEDPTTLTLALIGAATMAVYLAIRRSSRDRGAALVDISEVPTSRSQVAAAQQDVETVIEQPSRGAA